jgi:hypothetical protein
MRLSHLFPKPTTLGTSPNAPEVPSARQGRTVATVQLPRAMTAGAFSLVDLLAAAYLTSHLRSDERPGLPPTHRAPSGHAAAAGDRPIPAGYHPRSAGMIQVGPRRNMLERSQVKRIIFE